MFYIYIFSDLQMPITFANCEAHICSGFFLPVHVHIFVDMIVQDLNKGKESTALCSQ